MRGQEHPDRLIGRLADAQHGVVAIWQLLELGISRRAIEWRLGCGRLRPVHRGVYAVGHEALGREGRWMAAVLAGRRDAVLSHWSAATHLQLRRSTGPISHVTIPRRRRKLALVRFHFAKLPADEVSEKDGIPVTAPGRTLIDLAPITNAVVLGRMLEAAEARPWLGPSLPELLGRYERRAGVTRLATVWRQPRQRTRSDFEAEFLEAIDAEGLSRPQMNQVIEGHEVDAVWREAGVVVELDTYMTHGSRFAFERDRERDRTLQLAGWTVIRLTPVTLEQGLRELRRRLS